MHNFFVNTVRQSRITFLCGAVAFYTLSFTLSTTVQAGAGHKLFIDVNPITCEVVVQSRRPIGEISYGEDSAIHYTYNAAGHAIPIGKSYVLGQYSDLLPIENDLVFVKTTNKHYKKRSRGHVLSVDVPATPACEPEPEAACPPDVVDLIDTLPDFLLGTGTADLPASQERFLPISSSNDPLSCTLGDVSSIQPGGFAIAENESCEGFAATFQETATSPGVPRPVTICIETVEEARACAAEIGCDNF